ncbi:MAG: tetratricopeptide repeat protein [Myxococcales bacterium]
MLRLRALYFAFLLLIPAASFAQAPTSAPAPAVDAREAFRRGEAAYSAGNYDMAIREWSAAYSADPRPRIQFNLSQAYERIGDLEKAMAALRQFLDSADPDDPMYSDANARLSALQARIAATGLLVRGGAEGGLITVDQQDWGRTPRPDKITLAPGSHVLVVTWSGQPEFRTNVIVPAGQVIEVALPADAGKGAGGTVVVGGTTTTGGAATTDSGSNKKKWILIGVGSGVAAVGAGLLIYGGVRGGDKVDCDKDYCPDPGQNDSVKTQSIVGYAVGGALLAGGAGLIVWGALSGRDDKQQAATQCGVGFASATCKFRF